MAPRVVWGFAGSENARFPAFVRPPSEVLSFPRDGARLKARRYLGHNPAGGAMILALLALLGYVSITGMLLTADAFWGSDTMEAAREAGVHAPIGLVSPHLADVALASVEHGENLVRATITGRKRA